MLLVKDNVCWIVVFFVPEKITQFEVKKIIFLGNHTFPKENIRKTDEN